jgi:hypothetical protein
MNIDNWMHRENQALDRAIGTFIKPGDRVSSFLSGHDPVLPSLILGQIGQKGELHVITPGPYLESGLFSQFLDLFVDFQKIKGEEQQAKTPTQKGMESLDRRITGSGLIRHWVRTEANDLLTHPYRYSERFYAEGLNWQSTKLMERFFEHFHIHPHPMDDSMMPRGVASKSLDAVVEADRFSVIPEKDKEAALYELDRVLRPGGHLIIREGSREQAAIEYYGLELFDQHYRRINPPGTRSSQLVIMRKNLEPGQTERYTITTPSPIRAEAKPALPNSRQARKIRQARAELSKEIYGIIQAQENGAQEALSLTWFRTNGHLPLLISEYGGSIDKAIEAARATHQVEIQETNAFVKPPEGTKPFYTFDDLARELGVSKSQIKKGVGRVGVKGLAPVSSAGHSGFGKKSDASRQLNLSYKEFIVVRDALKRLNLKPNNGREVTKQKGQ